MWLTNHFEQLVRSSFFSTISSVRPIFWVTRPSAFFTDSYIRLSDQLFRPSYLATSWFVVLTDSPTRLSDRLARQFLFTNVVVFPTDPSVRASASASYSDWLARSLFLATSPSVYLTWLVRTSVIFIYLPAGPLANPNFRIWPYAYHTIWSNVKISVEATGNRLERCINSIQAWTSLFRFSSDVFVH